MSEADDIGSFLTENRKLLKTYVETRLEIFRLRAIRHFSRFAGLLSWILISLFLLFLFLVFAGIVIGLWLSKLTGSIVAGFGITTGVFLLLIVIVTLLRNVLIINPVVSKIISLADDEFTTNENEGKI